MNKEQTHERQQSSPNNALHLFETLNNLSILFLIPYKRTNKSMKWLTIFFCIVALHPFSLTTHTCEDLVFQCFELFLNDSHANTHIWTAKCIIIIVKISVMKMNYKPILKFLNLMTQFCNKMKFLNEFWSVYEFLFNVSTKWYFKLFLSYFVIKMKIKFKIHFQLIGFLHILINVEM